MLFIEKLPTRYDAGLASVTAGQKAVTPKDAAWLGNAWGDDLFFLPSQPLVPPQRIDAVNDDGTLTLAVGWPGTTETEVAYEIRYVGIIERSTAQTRKVLEQLSAIEANGRGLFYRFSDQPEDADPGSGRLRLNNIDPASATAIYIDNEDANGAAAAAEIDTWADSTSIIKGLLWLRSVADPSSAHAYAVSGAVVDGTGYRKLAVDYVGGSGTFAADEALMVAFARVGDRGDAYQTDATADDMAGLTAYDSEADGYRVFVRDLGAGYDNRSGVVVKAGASWEVVALYTGPKGGKGDTGDKGWSPRLVIVADGDRRVWQLAGYVGGQGSAPTANVGDYLKADGTWTSTIGDAADVRGPPGRDGAGTVAGLVEGDGITIDATDPTQPVVALADADDVRSIITLPSTPTALTYLRRDAGNAAWEERTIQQLREEIGGWETIAVANPTASVSTEFIDLSAYRTLRLTCALLPVAATVLGIQVSADNGATWLTSSSYTHSGYFMNSGVITPVAGAIASYIEIASGATGQIIDTSQIILTEFNKTVRTNTRVIKSGLHLDDRHVVDWGVEIDGNTAWNALRVTSSQNYSGQLVLEGVRG